MKKILVISFFLLILTLINNQIVFSQFGSIQIPGVDCGDAEASGSAKNCCKEIDVSLPSVPGAIRLIPGIGSWLDNLVKSTSKLKRATNIVPCPIGYPRPSVNDPNCVCLKESQITPFPVESIKNMCLRYIKKPEEQASCINCANQQGVWTAMGCVYGNLSKFIVSNIFSWGIGLGGIIALLCVIYSAFTLQMSQGNPEKIKKAQENLTSCILGLILIIFSVFVLRLIGVDILRIPGFGK